MAGVRLILMFPEVAGRDCGDCQKWVYNDSPEKMADGPMEYPPGSGRFNPRLPLDLVPSARPRCEWCPKVPRGSPPVPSSAVELSDKNWLAYRHYRECQAIGSFGTDAADPIVRRNAMVIRKVEDEARHVRELRSNVLALGSVFRRGS